MHTFFLFFTSLFYFFFPLFLSFVFLTSFRANPLGSGGILAEEFYILVTAIWLGEFRYIVPRDFKNTVSQVAPYFAGNDQHDSQEFLVYLLDGLHEDLNKVMHTCTCTV